MQDEDEFNKNEQKRSMKTERMRKGDEAFKVRDGVFDKAALMTLYGLIKAGKIETVEGIVSTGKEANVFWGYTPEGREVAIKIHRITAATFKNLWQYLIRDPRYKNIRKNHRHVVYGWAQREYKNLSRLLGSVPIPEPLFVKDNVIVMGFLGKDGIPYPKIKSVTPENPESDFKSIIGYIRTMYKNGIVHADLSEYNILVGRKSLFLIDFSQGTVVQNTNAPEFLRRDVENIIRYFSRYIDTPSVESVYEGIVGESDE